MQKLDKTKLVKNYNKKYKLTPYLDKVFRDFSEPFSFVYEPKQGDTAWHPSGDCTPKVSDLYERACKTMEGVAPPKPSESLNKSFLVGHFWHQLLQYIVLNKLEFCTPEAIERKEEVVWSTERTDRWGDGHTQMMSYRNVPKPFYWATGAGDIAPLELPSGWQGVVDFKTMNTATFNKDDVPFADKYECQINIYMDFFGEDKALIVGINKDSPHGFKEFEFERNQPLIDIIYEKWKEVGAWLEKGEKPPTKTDQQFETLPLTGPVLT